MALLLCNDIEEVMKLIHTKHTLIVKVLTPACDLACIKF